MRYLAVLILSFLLAGPLLAKTTLVLQDGRVLTGVDVRREGELYLLTQESGDVISLPFELVREVRLSTAPVPAESGLTYRVGSQTLAGNPDKPAGVFVGTGEVVAGHKVNQPTTAEQNAVFGAPAKFQKTVHTSDWKPSSDWTQDPENNNFAPSNWSESVVDNSWKPTSDWDPDPDKGNNFNRSTWSDSVVDNSWTPTDGFKKD